jgi:hypothetical protein
VFISLKTQNTFQKVHQTIFLCGLNKKHFSNVDPIKNNSQLSVISKTVSNQNTKYNFQNH